MRGPTGVGKTALMYELAGDTEREEWVVFRINTRCLADPVEQVRQLRAMRASHGIHQLEEIAKSAPACWTQAAVDF